jgi:hypothetical protein
MPLRRGCKCSAALSLGLYGNSETHDGVAHFIELIEGGQENITELFDGAQTLSTYLVALQLSAGQLPDIPIRNELIRQLNISAEALNIINQESTDFDLTFMNDAFHKYEEMRFQAFTVLLAVSMAVIVFICIATLLRKRALLIM